MLRNPEHQGHPGTGQEGMKGQLRASLIAVGKKVGDDGIGRDEE